MEFGTGCASKIRVDGVLLPLTTEEYIKQFAAARESVIMPVVEMSFPEYK